MTTAIDKAGRVVIPAKMRKRLGSTTRTSPRSRVRLARLVATENRRHFTPLLRHGIRVLVSSELVEEIGR